MSQFYVYMHLRNDGTPFYVGKGKGNRCRSKNRGRAWKYVVRKDYPETLEPKVVLLAKQLDEQTAFEIEQFWIAVFGRRDAQPNGTLVNHTDGGEGICGLIHKDVTKEKMRIKATGRIHTEESLKKMSEAASARVGEKNTFFGRTHSDESKKKISENGYGAKLSTEQRLELAIKKGAKPVWLLSPENVVFEVINKKRFCEEHSLNNAHLYELISGKRKRVSGWRLSSNQDGVVE